jgi:hypothetical protein
MCHSEHSDGEVKNPVTISHCTFLKRSFIPPCSIQDDTKKDKRLKNKKVREIIHTHKFQNITLPIGRLWMDFHKPTHHPFRSAQKLPKT